MLFYEKCSLGITNQKIALTGLAYEAMSQKKDIILPKIAIYDPKVNNGEDSQTVNLEDVFEIEPLINVLNAFGIDVREPTEPAAQTSDAWHCFCVGAEKYGEVGLLGRSALGEIGPQIIRALIPKNHIREFAKSLCDEIYNKRGVMYAIQMRIEKDWENFSNRFLSYQEIIRKTLNTFSNVNSLYILCDEKNTDKKNALSNYLWNNFNIKAYYKSDFFDIRDKNNLFLSLVDFEMAPNAPVFIGNSESTFASFVAYEKFCQTYEIVRGSYIYNVDGDFLLERYDNGGSTNSKFAEDKINTRAKIFELPFSLKERVFKAVLTTHISNYGNFVSAGLLKDGGILGNLVGGSVDNKSRKIEAFSLKSKSEDIVFEYRAKLSNGTVTEWRQDGEFSGTIGQGLPLSAFAVRLVGPVSLICGCMYAGYFEGEAFPVQSSDGEWCEVDGKSNLQAMQINFYEK